MYGSLPSAIQSRYGFQGCLATLDLGGESINPTADALVPSNFVVNGCEDKEDRCTLDMCSNGGLCEEKWSGPTCNCDMTSYTGPTCEQESISYDFGPGRGIILFTYPSDRRIDTHRDSIAFGFITADPDAILMRIDSSRSTDFLNVELVRQSFDFSCARNYLDAFGQCLFRFYKNLYKKYWFGRNMMFYDFFSVRRKIAFNIQYGTKRACDWRVSPTS